jgi:hypothetical protein
MSAFGGEAVETVITLCLRAVRLHREMSEAYDRIGRSQRERPGDDGAMREAQERADALGRRYERLCEQIYQAEPRTLEGVLAKLRCATRCIRDIVPEGKDPERLCDIELRFVFALERDVERLVRASMKKTYPSSIGKAANSAARF